MRKYMDELRAESYIEIRPGYADAGALEGMNTGWSDPSRLAPLTTTREEVIKARPRKEVDLGDEREEAGTAVEGAQAGAAAS